MFATVKNAVWIALLSRTGYAGILWVAGELSTRDLGIENKNDVAFQVSILADEMDAMRRGTPYWPNCGTGSLAVIVRQTDFITIHMPQKWNISSSVNCIFRKTRANRILVKQCTVFIMDCDVQCNEKLRVVIIERT